MSIVTTYVCDVSGKSGTSRANFVDVTITASGYTLTNGNPYLRPKMTITKLISKDIALKLNLVPPDKGEETQPEVTMEGKLKALLTDYIDSIVNESVAEQVSLALNNR
jgi:hypothetical protein